jgi:ankyrin repeat protein
MEHNKILFDTLKNHEWLRFMELLEQNPDIDINIKDEQDNYLISYAILYNNKKIVRELIKHSAYLDIVDSVGKSILYQAIQLGYNDMLKLLLEDHESIIGLPLIDIRDKDGHIPLHYAIVKKNVIATKLLIEKGSDINASDNDGNSSLQLAIYSKNRDLFDMILNTNPFINHVTTTGESALHIAINIGASKMARVLIDKGIDINLRDYEYEIGALDYAINMGDHEIVKYLIDKGVEINTQDYYGNTPIHYLLKENMLPILKIVTTSVSANFNLANAEGKIPLHILFDLDYTNIDEYLDVLIKPSNLNIQDNSGNSCLHLLVRTNLWKKYVKILIEKKLDIILRNVSNERPVDYVDGINLEKLINIVVDSYLYRLQNIPITWDSEWENICSKHKISTEDLTKLKELTKRKTSSDVCKTVIRDQITNMMKDLRYDIAKRPYPYKEDNLIHITEEPDVKFCTFVGITLDVLIGIIYLLKKHDNASSVITDNFVGNKALCKFYKSVGVSKDTTCEFMNFEIVWIYHKLYTPTNFHSVMTNVIKNNKRFILMPLGIEMRNGNHANFIIYDKKLNQMERFEPHGGSHPFGFNYKPDVLDAVLENKFKDILGKFKYIAPKEYLPKIGFQIIDSFESHMRKIGDPSGFCSLWAVWYADMRLTYPNIPGDILVNKMIKYIKKKNISFRNMIRNYSTNVTEIRDDILDRHNMDINIWLNEQYTTQQFENVVTDIAGTIRKLIS